MEVEKLSKDLGKYEIRDKKIWIAKEEVLKEQ